MFRRAKDNQSIATKVTGINPQQAQSTQIPERKYTETAENASTTVTTKSQSKQAAPGVTKAKKSIIGKTQVMQAITREQILSTKSLSDFTHLYVRNCLSWHCIYTKLSNARYLKTAQKWVGLTSQGAVTRKIPLEFFWAFVKGCC